MSSPDPKSLITEIEELYRQMVEHRDGAREKSFLAWDMAFNRFRRNIEFSIVNYELYIRGHQILRDICKDDTVWEPAADSLTSAEIFRADLEARRREK